MKLTCTKKDTFTTTIVWYCVEFSNIILFVRYCISVCKLYVVYGWVKTGQPYGETLVFIFILFRLVKSKNLFNVSPTFKTST